MHDFKYKDDGFFYCEDVKCEDLAGKYGTPLYVYSHKTFVDHFNKMKSAFSSVNSMVCYSVKTCSNLSLLKIIYGLGGGFDIVSIGEMQRVEKACGDVSRCVFAGVGKRSEEIEQAIDKGIYSFTVESQAELEMLNECAARLGKKASFALRINPDVDAKTHKHITTGKKENKFGIDADTAFDLYRNSRKLTSLMPEGIHMHIGSQITKLDPYVTAVLKVVELIYEIKKERIPLEYFDIGGGFGIIYDQEKPPTADEIGKKLIPLIKNLNMKILLEPGRFIAGNSGILLTKVIYIKEKPSKKFAIVDAGMNDLIRPSFYDAFHKIVRTSGGAGQKDKGPYDIVGPICESGDFLALDRPLPEVRAGDYLAVMSAGAYGFSMSSNYNSRTRAAEVLVKGAKSHLIRERETFDDLIRGEKLFES